MLKDSVSYNEYMANYMTKRYHKRRSQAIEYLGKKCNVCGVDTDLEIDHVNPEEKAFDLGKALSGWSWSRIVEELNKCQLLCKSCHDAKTRREGSTRFGKRERWEHGTVAGRRRGCKCRQCLDARARYMVDYRKRSKGQ